MASSSTAFDVLTGADTHFATPDFDPALTDWSFVEPLIVGAGGIGCELLHLLALSGFAHLTVLDMDFIELSNLNRQFLFTQADIGKAKSAVAAAAVMARCPRVSVTAVAGRLEAQSDEFYEKFDVVLLAVDSVPARRWVNRKMAQLATRTILATPSTTPTSSPAGSGSAEAAAATSASRGGRVVRSVGMHVIERATPIIDTGTEGFEGHCRVINLIHNTTPCIECEMYLYNNGTTRKTVPLCTLESVPRAPEHCVLYAQMKEWPEERGGEGGERQRHKAQGATRNEESSDSSRADEDTTLDPDNAEHVHWIAQRARARQVKFGIGGPPIDDLFTLGVIKNVVPAVGFTNAYVAGQAVTETLKWLTGCAPQLDNFAFFNGATEAGVFTDVHRCIGAPMAGGGDVGGRCLVCGPRPVVGVDAARVSPTAFVAGLIELLVTEEAVRTELRRGTASLMLPSGESGQVVEVALPPLGPHNHNKVKAKGVGGGDGGDGLVASAAAEGGDSAAAAASLADLLCAAGHADFVHEWATGSQMADVECFGGAEARISALVQWEGERGSGETGGGVAGD
ncbi:putative mitochondrial ubiquitin activating enzyme [Leptomonas pyrrhocoris]|uniref:NEDD8-activating enzyme E1 catalytic subunit n=1 Tax=Leptomonas pyrrhocoris TaxID=157538 RepID=A0A0M9FQ88_LEPPY|nr:putative mitochondrial ubiquitin activating enzyme [Leptomonas pyrrhocoris]KPA73773.1 putative mitochondrial ubiquitin activating enzyme [Leptomonas pyrrhocoris]|eukprot:XP_015652212.1 putative mitochondrial ubiquitin activating enzyme [Leptomonas pyrrhocoris]